mmetsp:Transcript_26099/g.46402  ORF Transcript_26099/g.46402 Transcript_26099/m.46402 type:complete len:295 (+) Transcript_26099:871-1755(+)
MLGDEVVRAGGPAGEDDVAHGLPVLTRAQREVVPVDEERGVGEEKLRDQLLDIRVVPPRHALPSLRDVEEQTVRRIEAAVLQSQHVTRRRAHQPKHDISGCRVMSAVQKGIRYTLDASRHLSVAPAQDLQSVGVEGTDGLGQVSVHLRVGEVQLWGRVVLQDPGEDGPLGEVAEGAAGSQVEEEQVLHVANARLLPGGRHLVQPFPLRLQHAGGHRSGLVPRKQRPPDGRLPQRDGRRALSFLVATEGEKSGRCVPYGAARDTTQASVRGVQEKDLHPNLTLRAAPTRDGDDIG